ncbi:MAG: hypothetical protein SF029_23405 [bacterium]|nr:hypothetical protein [bacterium]
MAAFWLTQPTTGSLRLHNGANTQGGFCLLPASAQSILPALPAFASPDAAARPYAAVGSAFGAASVTGRILGVGGMGQADERLFGDSGYSQNRWWYQSHWRPKPR